MRIALITGGASGLGLATARRLAADGLVVAVADLDALRVQQVARDLPGAGHIGLRVDVADEASVVAGFDAVESGLGPIAVLACFAGIASRDRQPRSVALVDQEAEEWDRVMDVNARGSFFCVREMLRRRTARRVEHGRVILVSSVAGQFGAIKSGAVYSASKGAVLSLTKVAAREAAPLGLTVNAIAPGPIDTPMLDGILGTGNAQMAQIAAAVPLGRVGTPQDIAAMASFLASLASGYVTGATFDVNGGLQMR